MLRQRRARILATLGPSSSTPDQIYALALAGADVFRLNFSHGSHDDHAARYHTIRSVERDIGRPIGVLMDLQGPKLRVGRMAGGKAVLETGSRFRLDLDATEGDATRAGMPHPEIFAALRPGTDLLLDDGKLRLRVDACGADFAETTVMVGGALSDRKGVNVPGVVLPISPLTTKDRADLAFGLELGVDWVALSFVQRPEDIVEARSLIGDRAWIMAKLEKPAAIDALDGIVALADGIMVARGDLGVELPPQQVPVLQRRIVHAARAAGRPVVVATQMLESMTTAPVPTRAEVSDVATAIYEGADAVMLSAESASGQYPRSGAGPALARRPGCEPQAGRQDDRGRHLLRAAPRDEFAGARRHRHVHRERRDVPAREPRASHCADPRLDAEDGHRAPPRARLGRASGAVRGGGRLRPHGGGRRRGRAFPWPGRCGRRRRRGGGLPVRASGPHEPAARRARGRGTGRVTMCASSAGRLW